MTAPTPRLQSIACALLASLLLACGEETGGDIAERLQALPGVTVVESGRPDVPEGYRFFTVDFEQPADHGDPGGARFVQRLRLLYTSDTAPMVLYTGGYMVSSEPTVRELAQLLGANQLMVEHRYFGTSRPEGDDWRHLTIEQSAADFHRIVEAFKPLFPGRWLSTGGSKGGKTMVIFRRFYPDDVDATVAYVAPLNRRDDDRFIPFLETVGTEDCRERLKTFQREVLTRREAMMSRMRGARGGGSTGLSFEHLGQEVALEHAAIEYSFYFWQYQNPSRCGRVPPASASDTELFQELDEVVGLSSFSDRELAAYGPYFYQSAHELGYPRAQERHLADLLRYPGTDVPERYIPRGLSVTYRPEAMADVQDWVATRGNRIMFIYGELDPWTAAAFNLGDAVDTYSYMVPGGNHGSRISQLPEPQRTQALSTLWRWAGLIPGWSIVQAESWRQEPEAEEQGPRRTLMDR